MTLTINKIIGCNQKKTENITKETPLLNKSTLKYLILKYVESLSPRCSQSTITTARKKLRSFEKHIVEVFNKELITINNIEEKHFVSFFNTRTTNPNSSTINIYYSILSRFFNYLELQNIVSTSFKNLKNVINPINLKINNEDFNRKEITNKRIIMTDVEIVMLIDYIKTKRNVSRNLLVILLLLQFPFSSKEIMNLKYSNFENKELTYLHNNKIVKGKIGNNSKKLVSELKKIGNGDYLFYNSDTSSKPPLFSETIRKTFLHFYDNSGIRVNQTKLQDTMVFKLYEKGNTIKTISTFTNSSIDNIQMIINDNVKQIVNSPY